MLLSVAAILVLFGLVLWILGESLEYEGIAVIGAVIVLGAGSMILTGGLEHRAGQVETVNSANETVVNYQTQPVDFPMQFPFGLLVMLVGGVAAVRTLDPGGG